jgi:hypothetical protein
MVTEARDASGLGQGQFLVFVNLSIKPQFPYNQQVFDEMNNHKFL